MAKDLKQNERVGFFNLFWNNYVSKEFVRFWFKIENDSYNK